MSSSTAKETAERLLVRREHSEHELKYKLLARSFSETEIENAISVLQEEGFQSDERFAQMYIHARKSRGYGPVSIIQGLKEKGIDPSLIDTAMEAIDETEWFELAEQQRQKRFGADIPDDYSLLSKQKRFLQQRGFSYEHIDNAVSHEE